MSDEIKRITEERDLARAERDAALAEVRACMDKQAEDEARYRDGVEAAGQLDDTRRAQRAAEMQAAADRARYDLACSRADLARAEAAALRAALLRIAFDDDVDTSDALGCARVASSVLASTTTGADVLDLMRRMAASCLDACERKALHRESCPACAVLADYKRLMGGGA